MKISSLKHFNKIKGIIHAWYESMDITYPDKKKIEDIREDWIRSKKKYDFSKNNICTHPNHAFPNMLYIPPGQSFTHVCPGCGQSTTITGQGVYCENNISNTKDLST